MLKLYQLFSSENNRTLSSLAKFMTYICVCARRARLCVWIGLTNILFIDESMAVHILFFGFIIWNYSWVRYNT